MGKSENGNANFTFPGSQTKAWQVAETADAVARISEAPVWGAHVDEQSHDQRLRPGTNRLACGSIMDELVFGHDIDFSHHDAEVNHYFFWMAKSLIAMMPNGRVENLIQSVFASVSS